MGYDGRCLHASSNLRILLKSYSFTLRFTVVDYFVIAQSSAVKLLSALV